ncbi:MAG: hypothetical protein WCP35_13515 [Verrucomicrobiota bacterium]
MPQEPENPDPGVADYFERHGIDVGSMLIARAPDVIILARLKGAPKTAGYFSEILKVAVTEKHIKGIKLGVKTRRIHVTEEELINAALSHPTSAARLLRDPSLAMIDPRQPGRKSATTRVPNKKVKQGAGENPVKRTVPHPLATDAVVSRPMEERPASAGPSASHPSTLSSEKERTAMDLFDAADEAGE